MKLSAESLGYLIHRCTQTKSLTHGLTLHGTALKSGIAADAIVSNHIINLYSKCGRISSAHNLFEEMPDKNVISWAALISGYHHEKNPVIAFQLLKIMPFVANESILASVISACAGEGLLALGRQVHARAVVVGCGDHCYVGNALISLYMKCGRYGNALDVFGGNGFVSNTVTYNILIAGFAENGRAEKGIELFREMCDRGVVMDHFTYTSVLRACTDVGDMNGGLQLHCGAIKLKLDSTTFVGNVIITLYSKFECVEEAEKVFRTIDEKDIISWNTIITVLSQGADCTKGLDVFRELLKEKNIKPDDFTFSSVLAACADEASIYHGKQIHAHMMRTMNDHDVGVENALVDMYAKCGSIGYAYKIFKLMKHLNLISWNCIIAAFGNHGQGKNALALFEQMKERHVRPDCLTFTSLLIACNHAGLIDEGMNLFDSMVDAYGISPDIMHLSCLVDMLARAGRLDDAERYMKRFPSGDEDPVVLGSLLSACWLRGQTVTGERLGEQLLRFPPASTSPFVLLSNLYASDKMWMGAAEVRRILKGSGLKKEPGYSLVEVHGRVEKFTVGDLSHSRIKEMKDVLCTIRLKEDELTHL